MRVLVLLSIFLSFFASATVYEFVGYGNNPNIGQACWGLSAGQIYDPVGLPDCTGTVYEAYGRRFEIILASVDTIYFSAVARRDDGRTYTGKATGKATNLTCQAPMEMHNGICQLVPDEDKPFCDRRSTQEELAAASEACAVTEGIFSSSCSNENESLSMKCTQPESCVIGDPSWPECMSDFDPTAPFNPPPSDFNPSTGTTVEKGDSYDKQEPDTVTPDATTDTGVLEAIQNLNRDTNAGLSSLDGNLTQGFADVNTALNNLDATNNGIGQSIVDQMNQDYAIYQGQKDLQLQTTGAIQAYGAETTAAVKGTTAAVKDNTDAIGELGDRLESKLDELTPCEPTEANNYCENPHGLESALVTQIMQEIDNHSAATLDGVETLLVGEATDIATTPLTGEVESNISGVVDSVMALLPDYGSCSPLNFNLGSRVVSFSCDISATIKTILSFLFYFYTALYLLDVLFSEVTPVPGTRRASLGG
ncbi:hypothetical protein [Vibrio marisflavi]|uniref:Uncharacterized protein n=1 Tax=Vibrio marisflavi CECT 7928 TaxID=634439 RepID=A0ABN8E2Z0_9VIBR|nr:hypothetical protein [Vibrio marisflavi]CAH0536855.1 hypothetical protein VMF7928_00746 [Vibrio marisflavi CECT 7928]